MATKPPTTADLPPESEFGPVSEIDRGAEIEHARRLAERYRLEFVDMETFRIDQDLFRSIPADLMLRPLPPQRADARDRGFRPDRPADD